MQNLLDRPYFCVTGDVDWASDYCVGDFIDLLIHYGVKPTLFATNESPLLKSFISSGKIDFGIHPNFFPNSTQGSDYISIIDNLLSIYEDAKAFRSHAFYDNAYITVEMARRGILYDSNLCLYLQPHIVPLNHAMGLTRFPVFWEDDNHFLRTNGDWNFAAYRCDFFTPGLKILNFHPFNVCVNTPNDAYYRSVRKHSQHLSADSTHRLRHPGKGVRTFLKDFLMVTTAKGYAFYTLNELYQMFPIAGFMESRRGLSSTKSSQCSSERSNDGTFSES